MSLLSYVSGTNWSWMAMHFSVDDLVPNCNWFYPRSFTIWFSRNYMRKWGTLELNVWYIWRETDSFGHTCNGTLNTMSQTCVGASRRDDQIARLGIPSKTSQRQHPLRWCQSTSSTWKEVWEGTNIYWSSWTISPASHKLIQRGTRLGRRPLTKYSTILSCGLAFPTNCITTKGGNSRTSSSRDYNNCVVSPLQEPPHTTPKATARWNGSTGPSWPCSAPFQRGTRRVGRMP